MPYACYIDLCTVIILDETGVGESELSPDISISSMSAICASILVETKNGSHPEQGKDICCLLYRRSFFSKASSLLVPVTFLNPIIDEFAPDSFAHGPPVSPRPATERKSEMAHPFGTVADPVRQDGKPGRNFCKLGHDDVSAFLQIQRLDDLLDDLVRGNGGHEEVEQPSGYHRVRAQRTHAREHGGLDQACGE